MVVSGRLTVENCRAVSVMVVRVATVMVLVTAWVSVMVE